MKSLVPVVALVLLATAAAYDNGLAALPPMGWNTWCTDDLCGMTLQQRWFYDDSVMFAALFSLLFSLFPSQAPVVERPHAIPSSGALDRCYDHEIRSVADAIVEQGLDKLGYQYVNMDDCWSATTRDSSGQLQVHATLSAPHRSWHVTCRAARRPSLSPRHEATGRLRALQRTENRFVHVRRHSHLQVRQARQLRPLRRRRAHVGLMGHRLCQGRQLPPRAGHRHSAAVH